MKDHGYEVGRNLIVDMRYAEGDPARLSALVDEILGLKPDVLLGATFVEEYAQDGGLISYGPSFVENLRRVAYYVDRIFKGAKPGDLPIEQPTKFSLVINAKTAKALGIKIPGSILLRAERVIE